MVSRATIRPASGEIPPRSARGSEPTRRVNITMLESHHDELARRGVNVSGLIRELLDGYLSERTITLEVDPETRSLFHEALKRSGATSLDLGVHLRRALCELLDDQMKELASLRRELARKA